MSSGNSNFFANMVDTALRITTNNMASFDQDGGFSFQTGRNVAIAGIKELTGATATEEATEQAEKVFQAQEEAAEKDRRERSAQFAKEQISKSKRASTSRNTQASKSNKKTTSGTSGPSTSKLGNGGGEQDFLGL